MEHKPPQIHAMWFCPRCGRDDRVINLTDRHFADGKLCLGILTKLVYVVPSDPKRLSLERAIIEATREARLMEQAADSGSNIITRTEALIKMQRAMKAQRSAVDALIAFEAGKQG